MLLRTLCPLFLVCLLLPVADGAFAAEGRISFPAAMFREAPDREGLWEAFPDYNLTVEHRRALFEEVDADPIIEMLDSDGTIARGYMTFTVQAPPPTVWEIITAAEDFDTVDPAFPKYKGETSFMPYVRYCNVCIEDGLTILYQLLELPSVAPRKFTSVRLDNHDGFPWETRWYLDNNFSCVGEVPEELHDLLEKSVPMETNSGSWRLEPYPSGYRDGENAFDRTWVRYYVNSSPGGSVGKKAWLARMGQKKALPKIADVIRIHASRWLEYLQEHKAPGDVARYQAFVKAYHNVVD